jgi:naphthoate synthase
MDAAARRLQVVRDHISPAEQDACRDGTPKSVSAPAMARQPTAAGASGGASSSYERIHGEVSREPAQWRNLPSVAREALQEVLYEKADADGIARVRNCLHLVMFLDADLKLMGTRAELLSECCTRTAHVPSEKFSLSVPGMQIVINRPNKRNAFTPLTVREMSLCFADARDDPAIGVIVLTGTPACPYYQLAHSRCYLPRLAKAGVEVVQNN